MIRAAAMLFLTSLVTAITSAQGEAQVQKSESFDRDPQWDCLNNRAARPVKVRQDFGYSASDKRIGGVITIAGEPAFYARKIEPLTLDRKLSASGTLICKKGSDMAMIGFFNADTANAWRTPNSLVVRILGRGDRFYAYEEYCTGKWRAGSNRFTGPNDKNRDAEAGFPAGDAVYQWSLGYDPDANKGGGAITLTFNGQTTITNLDPGHKLDGATFNRFGLFNVMKHASDEAEVWIGDLTINGERQDLSDDPKWDALGNRRTYESRDKRPYSDYGFSPTHLAGGKASGELGGLIFRGDIRLPDGVNYYGDRLAGELSLEKPLKASGRIVVPRAVQDSATLIGFFHVPTSVTINPNSPKSPRSWTDYVPKSFFGVAVKGPAREGYFFHPTYRLNGDEGGGNPGNAIANCPHLNPDGIARDWSFAYDPAAANGRGRVTVTLDGRSAALDLLADHKTAGARFNRFGIVSNWVDGNGQVTYLDDLNYTVAQE
jgi:hypothetical protein